MIPCTHLHSLLTRPTVVISALLPFVFAQTAISWAKKIATLYVGLAIHL